MVGVVIHIVYMHSTELSKYEDSVVFIIYFTTIKINQPKLLKHKGVVRSQGSRGVEART